jgi:hypothetical protein
VPIDRQRSTDIRAQQNGVLLDYKQLAGAVVGGGRHVGCELCDIGPDTYYHACAEADVFPIDFLGGGSYVETGFHAHAEEGGEYDTGALDCYRKEFEITSVAKVWLIYIHGKGPCSGNWVRD